MKIVNETETALFYWVSAGSGMADCGEIAVDDVVDLPAYDNQQNVTVSFLPGGGSDYISTTWPTTQTDEQTQLVLVAE